MLRVAYLEPCSDPQGEHASSTAAIVAALEQHVELTRFGPPGGSSPDWRRIVPKRFDRVLGVFENCGDLVHGLAPLRKLGGIAALHGWRMDALAQAHSPSLCRPGSLAGAIAALRHGGWGEMQAWRAMGAGKAPGGQAGTEPAGPLGLNHGVVRWADGFLVEQRELAHRIQDERNAPTAIQILPLVTDASRADASPEALARRWAEALEVLPTHRTGAKSLIATAIAGADAAREAREAESQSLR